MPRVKKSTKANQNGVEVAVVSSTTNSIFSEEEEEKVVPARPTGRSRAKKATTTVAEVQVHEVVKKVSARGRKKVVAAEIEEPEKVLEAEKKPSARGRAKKKTAEEETAEPLETAQSTEKLEDAPKPAKGAGKGRKKKEPTPVPEEVKEDEEKEAPAARKRTTKKQTAALEMPPTSKKTAAAKAKNSKDDLEMEVPEVTKKPAAKRRVGKSATPEAVENVVEAVESPKKKARTATVEKKKRGGAKQSAAAVIDESGEEEKVVDAKVADAVSENKPKRTRKRIAAIVEEEQEDVDEVVDDSKPSKAKKVAPLNATGSAYNKSDFDLPPLENGADDSTAERFNLKISSWNVAGLRAWIKKDGLKFVEYEEPDIFCLQETKCTTEQLPEEAERITGYHPYWLCMPGGHDGVAIYSKIMPINVEYGIGNVEFDDAGRLITAEYEKFFLINVYVPNSGRKLVRLEPRMRWEKLFQAYVQQLEQRKPVIICGDMNVSHREIDLANPKANTRNAGFTQEERDKMTELLALGYVDTFRLLYPDRKGAYTFWTYMGNARSRNVGWRLDYFLVSERLSQRVVENCMRTQCMGSDHCPITLFLKI